MISDGNKQLGQHCYDLSHLLQQFPQVTACTSWPFVGSSFRELAFRPALAKYLLC
jgi:hypothetical protein